MTWFESSSRHKLSQNICCSSIPIIHKKCIGIFLCVLWFCRILYSGRRSSDEYFYWKLRLAGPARQWDKNILLYSLFRFFLKKDYSCLYPQALPAWINAEFGDLKKRKKAPGFCREPMSLMWFEHTTYRLGGGRSIQLSYRDKSPFFGLKPRAGVP